METNNNYYILIDKLKKKYGEIKESYFLDEKCTRPNNKIKRGKDGLFIHHTNEDKYVMLSNKDYIILQNVPFSTQLGCNLVYCNYLEHLELHLLIYQNADAGKLYGIGGIINYMCREINDWIYHNNQIEYWGSLQWKGKCFECIKNNMNQYIKLLQLTFKTMKLKNCDDAMISLLWRKSSFFGSTEIPELKELIIGKSKINDA